MLGNTLDEESNLQFSRQKLNLLKLRMSKRKKSETEG